MVRDEHLVATSGAELRVGEGPAAGISVVGSMRSPSGRYGVKGPSAGAGLTWSLSPYAAASLPTSSVVPRGTREPAGSLAAAVARNVRVEC